jgi:hypothetical protein
VVGITEYLVIAAPGPLKPSRCPGRSKRIEHAAYEETPTAFFDVNETLLDLSAMKAGVAQALEGQADLLSLWFTTMLQYPLVATVGDNYDDFVEIEAAVMMPNSQTTLRRRGLDDPTPFRRVLRKIPKEFLAPE